MNLYECIFFGKIIDKQSDCPFPCLTTGGSTGMNVTNQCLQPLCFGSRWIKAQRREFYYTHLMISGRPHSIDWLTIIFPRWILPCLALSVEYNLSGKPCPKTHLSGNQQFLSYVLSVTTWLPKKLLFHIIHHLQTNPHTSIRSSDAEIREQLQNPLHKADPVVRTPGHDFFEVWT